MQTDRQRNGRRALGAAVALGALPALAAADTGIALAAGFRPHHAMAWFVAAGGLAVAGAVSLLWARPRGRAWLARNAGRCAAVVAAVTLAWVAAEVLAATLLGARVEFHLHAPGRYTIHPRADVIRGVAGPSVVTFNARGVRGRDLSLDRSVRRVLCVGGSTTLCFYLDDSETWPAVIEAELRAGGEACWVGNVGQNAYGTRHHVRFTRASSLLREVDDVVFLVGFNDFMQALLGKSLEAGEGITPLWMRLPLAAAVEGLFLARRTEALFVDDEFGGIYEARRHLRESSRVVGTLPDLGPALATYRRTLRAMVAHVRAAGARPTFATNPAKWRADGAADGDLWFGHVGDGAVLGTAALVTGLAAFEQATRELCAELEVSYVDLRALNGDDAVFFDDCHFTEEGARRVGMAVAAGLRSASRR